jgi:hypothetical protein
MEDLTGKVVLGTVTAAEWNQMPQEMQNVITDILTAGLDPLDLNQLGKAIAGYAAAGDFFSDTGAADAYDLAPVGNRQGPDDMGADMDGFRARFRAANANATTTPTVDFTTASGGPWTITDEEGNALVAGDIPTTRDTEIRFDQTAGEFILMKFNAPPSAVVAPQDYIDGFILSPDVGNETDDINFGPGICRDSTNTATMARAEITKQLDNPWVAGNDAGGLFNGSVAADTWYHCFIIYDPVADIVDAGFDTSPIAANRPGAYTKFRRVGSIRTEVGSVDIKQFVQVGNLFQWENIVTNEFDNAATGTTALDVTLSGVPPDVENLAVVHYYGTGNGRSTALYPKFITSDLTAAADPNVNTFRSPSSETGTPGSCRLMTDTSQKARIVSTASAVSRVSTAGWYDARGEGFKRF